VELEWELELEWLLDLPGRAHQMKRKGICGTCSSYQSYDAQLPKHG